MTGREVAYVVGIVDNEGFDYAFRNYSNFEDIKDEKFHELRKKYLSAAEELIEYCGLED